MSMAFLFSILFFSFPLGAILGAWLYHRGRTSQSPMIHVAVPEILKRAKVKDEKPLPIPRDRP